MPKLLVYTCVFGGYDRVFPPVMPESGVDYVLVTDDPGLSVPGWRSVVVVTTRFRTAKAPNRYYKMLAHRDLLPGYDVSIYVDGNIRVLGRLGEFVSRFRASDCAIGIHRHPVRHSVEEESKSCLEVGKLLDAERITAEVDTYRLDGFPDDLGLMETGIVLKNHRHPALDGAMDLWWSLFERFDSRDQFSLPYVIWKLGLPTCWLEPSFRDPNPHFGIYPHFTDSRAPRRYAYFAARSFDSLRYRVLLRLWDEKWRLQRLVRRMRGPAA